MNYKEFENVNFIRTNILNSKSLPDSIFQLWCTINHYRECLRLNSKEAWLNVILRKTTIVEITPITQGDMLVAYVCDSPLELLEKYPELFL